MRQKHQINLQQMRTGSMYKIAEHMAASRNILNWIQAVQKMVNP